MLVYNVSVVVPNYNGIEFLKTCLDSIKNQVMSTDNIDMELIIVDNASNDMSIRFIEDYVSKIRETTQFHYTLIENKTNKGFAKAVNQGIKASTSEYICLLNNDVELEDNFLISLVKCMNKDENIFAANSKMIQFHNRNLIDDAGDEYNLLAWTKKEGEGKHKELYDTSYEVFSACGGASMYRKSILDEIGLFDENFFAYMEDVDLSYRAQINGYKIVFCPNAEVYHIGSGSSGSRYNDFKIPLAARNNVWVVYKNMPWPQKLINILFLFFGFLIKYLFFLNKGFGNLYINGIKEGLNNRDKINKVEFKHENWKNYFKIEWKLIKNMFKYPL